MDASVPRIQPEPVVTGPRAGSRAPERRRRGSEQRGDGLPSFPLDPRPAPERGEHAQPRSPQGDGLGEHLDVTA